MDCVSEHMIGGCCLHSCHCCGLNHVHVVVTLEATLANMCRVLWHGPCQQVY